MCRHNHSTNKPINGISIAPIYHTKWEHTALCNNTNTHTCVRACAHARCVRACVHACMHACVCVCERERERERQTETERQRETETDRERERERERRGESNLDRASVPLTEAMLIILKSRHATSEMSTLPLK